MWFFNKSKKAQREDVAQAAVIEIEAHKDAQKEAVTIARNASKQLNTLLVNNGFTLKIYLAAGGTHPKEGHRK